jgi:hypothetical protein
MFSALFRRWARASAHESHLRRRPDDRFSRLLNFPAFHAAAAEWRARGWHVENPAEINADPTAGWHECMRADIARLVTCNAIYLLPGWKLSRGARIEAHIARELDMAVHESPGVELTGEQATALHLIRQHEAQHGRPPSFKAIGVDMGVPDQNARELRAAAPAQGAGDAAQAARAARHGRAVQAAEAAA